MRKIKLVLMLVVVMTLSACTKKDDNKLVIYSPSSEGIINAVIPLFEKKTDINVELISAGTGEALKRIESEADNPYADVLFGVSYSQLLSNTELFDTYVSKENDHVEEAYQNSSGFVTYFILDGSVIIVNKDLSKDITIDSYESLLDPKLKGKIAMADPATSGSAFSQLTNILLSMSDDDSYTSEKSWNYVGQLIQNLDGKIQTSSSSVYKSVVDGEMVVGLSYEDPVTKLVKDGADNVEIVLPKEGAVYTPTGASLVKNAKNKENAEKFLDFIISEEVQNIFGTELTNRPVRKGAKVADYMMDLSKATIKYEDMNYILEHKEDIIEHYTKLFSELN